MAVRRVPCARLAIEPGSSHELVPSGPGDGLLHSYKKFTLLWVVTRSHKRDSTLGHVVAKASQGYYFVLPLPRGDTYVRSRWAGRAAGSASPLTPGISWPSCSCCCCSQLSPLSTLSSLSPLRSPFSGVGPSAVAPRSHEMRHCHRKRNTQDAHVYTTHEQYTSSSMSKRSLVT